ncbi:competence protein B [Haemophilus haemolyticus]|uniref:competence protein B n=1 Tax=Haemophilus haemolyticus TaxID=726 RepID=UPI00112ECB01|nr:competence protein B [Haemophilus haemolyticus]TPH26296.1 competence protein B [Haemophilus haemolyticus]
MSMNLLPWRTYQHQKRLRRLVFYFALFILLAINLTLAFSNLIEQQKQNLQAQQKSFEQLNQQLHKTTTQIDQLRSAVKVGEILHSLTNRQVQNSLQQLSELPLQKGELNRFKQDAHNLSLEGRAQDQTEFESVHQFLKKHFPNVKLSQVQPEQHTLFFRFDMEQGEEK